MPFCFKELEERICERRGGGGEGGSSKLKRALNVQGSFAEDVKGIRVCEYHHYIL